MIDDTVTEHHQNQKGTDWYEIEVEGHFTPGWFSWLDGWEISPLTIGNTLLAGRVIDQPALHGIFAQLRDLNIKIVSLKIRTPPAFAQTLTE